MRRLYGRLMGDCRPAADSDEVGSRGADVYKSYNEIQKAQGMNLEKYRGKIVKRYTFDIVNQLRMSANAAYL